MTEFLYKINEFLGKIVWGPVMISIICITGIYLTIRTRFFQINLIQVFKHTIGAIKKDKSHAKDGISPFASMSAALGGTLGTGNIVGVATAIVAGGPGAIFWMWISAFLGMITKYSEVLLACIYRNRDSHGNYYGGPMYYMKNGLKMKPLAILFSVFCVFASFGTGNMAQTNSVSTSLYDAFNIPLYVSGIATAIITAIIISGGMKRITGFTEKLVPFMGLAYTLGAIIVVVINIRQMPGVVTNIVQSAFNRSAVVGGGAGYLMSTAMRYGFSRGVFSNEAGLGSAPIAHSTANFSSPVKQGMWGIFEVFFDTVVMCTLTAFVILSSGLWDSGQNGITLTSNAFSTIFGESSRTILSIFSVFFALSSIICWAYYGEVSVKYLFKKGDLAVKFYRTIFIIMTFVGSVTAVDFVFDVSDTLNGLMAVPNIIAVLLLSPVVIKYTKEYRKDKKQQEDK